MKRTFYFILIMLFVITGAHGQLATYSGTGGSSIAVTGYANETVSSLQYSGFGTNTSCSSGGLSGITVNTSWATYSTSGPIVYFQILPNVGYQLNVTGFDAGLRRSGTGPTCVRFAYSLDNGTTWTDDGACHAPNNGSCGSTAVSSWSGGALPTGITNTTWGIIVALFPYAPGGSTGTFQVNTINISGTVTSGCVPPTIISGLTTVCAGQNITLSNGSTGGVWTSNNTSVANVSSSGVVSGISGGSAIITYATGCGTDATTTVSVTPVPGTITGGSFVCTGLNITLSDAASGGAWSSSNTSVADINTSGVVTGGTPGSATITYSTGCGANATTVVTVNTAPSGITGNTTICSGANTALSDPTSGGIWSSNNTSVATVTNTGVTYGVAGGSATINYSTGCGSDAMATISVNQSPSVIAGNTLICAGTATALSDAIGGGTWSSDNTSVATIDASGIVSGISPGTTNITYTLGSAICAAAAIVTVNTAPSVLSGPTAICGGLPISLSNTVSGGVWSSSNSAVAVVSAAGVLSGLSAGVTNISYAIGSCMTGMAVTVSTISPITGSSGSSTCPGTVISFNDATSGGIWSSDNTLVATVSTTGDVTGISGGTANISYTIGACIEIVPVAIANLAPIAGNTNLCTVGATTPLNDVTPGGVWSSANTSIATVSGTGLVYSISAGVVDITYTLGGCFRTITISINELLPIVGSNNVCAGSTIALTDGTPGGIWSSAAPGAATISATGVITGITSGSAAIFYTLGSCAVGQLVWVGNPITPISGPSSLCARTSITLSDNTIGGTWSSDNVAIATTSGAVVFGIAAGTANISYTNGICYVSYPVTVNHADAGLITGLNSVCVGQVITLSDTVNGGVWSSGTISRATVNLATGVVTGLLSGVDTIRYTVTGVCGTFTSKEAIFVLSAAQCATGVGQAANDQLTELKIFPNPNQGLFTMNMLSDIDEEVHVVVTNILGEKVKELTTVTNKAVDIRLDHTAGIYLLSASVASGRYVAKIVIN